MEIPYYVAPYMRRFRIIWCFICNAHSFLTGARQASEEVLTTIFTTIMDGFLQSNEDFSQALGRILLDVRVCKHYIRMTFNAEITFSLVFSGIF